METKKEDNYMEATKLGKFIATIRKEKQLTQAELARKLNVTDKAVSRWERGLGFPDINTLEPLADALGITLTQLMKCSKEIEENSDDEIIASLDIAQKQRKVTLKRLIIGLLCSIIGITAIFHALKLFLTHTWVLNLQGGDGPTSVFIAGKTGNFPPTIILIFGGLMLTYGVWEIWKANNHDK